MDDGSQKNALPTLRQGGDDDLDLLYAWYAVSQRKWDIFALAVVISLATGLVVLSMPPVFQSTSTLLIESDPSRVVSIEEIYGVDTSTDEYYKTQFEILKSRELAEQVIDELDLENHPEFDPEKNNVGIKRKLRAWLPFLPKPPPMTEHVRRNHIVAKFKSRLAVKPLRKTQLAKITFEAQDPVLAAAVPNSLAQAYIDDHLDARMQANQGAVGWLTQRLSVLKEQLDDSQRRLQEYREREGLVDVRDGVESVAETELDLTNRQLVEARKARTDAEFAYRQVQGVPRSQRGSIPAVLRDPLVNQLQVRVAEAERRIAELGRRYGNKHPKMIAARAELNTARSSLKRQIDSVVDGIEKEYQAALANEQALLAAMESSKGGARELNRKEFALLELEREVNANQQLYDTFFTRLRETSATDDMQSAIARIVDRAVVPVTPAKPRKAMTIFTAFIMSLGGGVVLAFVLDHMNDSLKGVEDVEVRIGLPVLGTLPLIRVRSGEEKRMQRTFIEENKSSFSEAIRTVRTGLVLSGMDRDNKVVVVTSSLSGEGKTTLSINLAYALGAMEKVILIDADMRRPSLAKACDIPSDAPGLSNLVQGSEALDHCIHRFEPGNIDVMPAGPIPPNPLELISSERFSLMLEYLARQYAWVILDSAPTQAVSDSMVLSTFADSVLYVARSEKTSGKLVKNTIHRLVRSGAPVVGVVLNQMDMKKAAKYGEYYAAYYGGYYGLDEYYGSRDDDKGKKKIFR